MLKSKQIKEPCFLSLKTVYLGIGTNKGFREKNILTAIKLLRNIKEIKLLKVSNLLKNPPQEGIKNGYFLNGAIKLITSLTPLELLKVCKKIERKLGRNLRPGKKIARVIDLDILFYGNEIINTEELTIPHRMIEKRYFVLIPLMEISENFVHPALKKSVSELYSELGEDVKKYA